MSRACQSCARAFEDGEPLDTALLRGPEGYQRVDLCAECWAKEWADPSRRPENFVSHWKSRYRAPRPEAEPIRKETAEELLRHLIERGEARMAGACFILCVMLERKKILRMKARTRAEGRLWLHYEHARTGESFSVPDPELKLNELDVVQRQVGALLERGPEALEREGALGSDDAASADQAPSDKPFPEQTARERADS